MRIGHLTRRDLLKSGGALIVSFAFGDVFPRGPGTLAAQGGATAAGVGSPNPGSIDSFLAVHADGSVTLFTSHVDVGTGLSMVYRQIAAEELGIPVERFDVIEGDTATTPNHGGTGGSTGVPRGGADIRRVAATAREALLRLGAAQLGRPVSELAVADGEVRPLSGGTGLAVAALIGDKRFSLDVDPNAPLKDPRNYTVIGKPILRADVPAKCTAREVFLQDLSVPGMLHARVIHPPARGAKIRSIDKTSIQAIPDARALGDGDLVAVVANDEWAAIRAARELKLTWSDWQGLPGSDGFDRYLRHAPNAGGQQAVNNGDADAALAGATRPLAATYYWPFQSHGSLGPSCAVADVKATGATIWSSTQNPHGLRTNMATVLGMSPSQVHVVYMDGSGSYGSNGAEEAANAAVRLSRAAGAPVRLQWMRQDELGWDPKGPAQLLDLRGGLDANGRIAAWTTEIWMPGGPVTQNADPPYAVANLRVTSHSVETPLRLSNLRAPGKIGNVFAVESFTDELAVAAGADAIAFRRQGLRDPRALAVIERVAAMMGWEARPSPNPRAAQGDFLVGRGFAYMRYKQAENYVAMGMEVSVDPRSGRILVRRIVCAHDCGLIMNPDGLRNQVEGNIMQTLSRTLHEEVKFDTSKVTSVDWASYPILTFPEAPAIDVALIDHPDQPAYGAGEAASAPVAGALANAIFDATGVRLRSVPFTTERVRTALTSQRTPSAAAAR